MNAQVETKVKQYLRKRFQYTPLQAGTLVYLFREAARVTGHDLDEDFAGIGLSAGTQAKLASEVVGRALGAGAYTTGEGALRKHLNRLLGKRRSMHFAQM
jgi:hypothetical protein